CAASAVAHGAIGGTGRPFSPVVSIATAFTATVIRWRTRSALSGHMLGPVQSTAASAIVDALGARDRDVFEPRILVRQDALRVVDLACVKDAHGCRQPGVVAHRDADRDARL